MNHLTDREFVDALDGELSSQSAVHVRDCPRCRTRLADLSEALTQAGVAGVPEPSPLFWDHLSARIRDEIAQRAEPGRTRWMAWPVWAPLGGLALIVAILIAGLVRGVPSRSAVVTTADVRLQDDEAFEAAWALTAQLMASGDALQAEGIVRPGSAELVAANLTPDEQLELVRLLQLELKAGG